MTSATEILPSTPDESATREQIINAYQATDPPTDCWENFGDATPEHNHGIWCVYDEEHNTWEFVLTQPASEVHVDADELSYDDAGEQYVETGEVSAKDVITTDGEWTDKAQRVIDSLSSAHALPTGAVVDEQLTSFIATFIDSTPHRQYLSHVRSDTDLEGVVQEDNYQEVISRFGVTSTC